MLQNGWALESDFLQNDPRNPAYMSLEASHFIGEISTGIYILYIYIILCPDIIGYPCKTHIVAVIHTRKIL